jgi:hypothetical protein
MAGLDLHRLNITAPGGILLTGREAADTIWNMYNEAFPTTSWRSSPSTPTTVAASTKAARSARTRGPSAARPA